MPPSGETESAFWARLGGVLRRVPRQERARAVIDAVIEAAEHSLEAADEGPLQSLFVRAGVAAGSFYEYFGSREALLAAVMERVTDRNFRSFLDALDALLARGGDFESTSRAIASHIAAGYYARPVAFRRLVLIGLRLGFMPHIARERDRFADAVSERMERFMPDVPAARRDAMMRAVSDAVMGVVVVAAHRDPPPPMHEVERAAADAAWGVLRVHLGR